MIFRKPNFTRLKEIVTKYDNARCISTDEEEEDARGEGKGEREEDNN